METSETNKETSKALLNIFRAFCSNAKEERHLGTEKAEVLVLEVQGGLKLIREFYYADAMTIKDIDTAADLAEETMEKLTEYIKK